MQKRFIPAHKIGKEHIGKPAMIRLRNGAVLYGTVKKVRNNGIIFVPIRKHQPRNQTKANLFFFPFLFIPFFFFGGVILFF
ncbi:hypothetical protein [Melghirimyces algeriensis]|uniref:Uncharacterized protein n=1 Tax=Melghirimyces algeriensis TaxID=910412 RepID=A0A521AEW1_9BACL|nr:hypothetical protein [Melghirimyces algeriensis]SMO33332.1 hypothetical protein SAMN06264849_101100 [Melghirimyces algeriensis]